MEMPALYPLQFQPILRELIWGGRRLGTVLHKPIGPASDYAESWEVSDYHDQVSVVGEGPLAGTTLRELVRSRPLELLGPAVGPREQFPLLVKFIDANQDLSVQVHPDDEKGRRLAGDNGKTEAWVIVAAEPGSVIYAGLEHGVGADEFRRAIEAGRVEPLLHRFEARPGDSVLIEAGTVHAIGAGVLLAEIQQMSDATFRVFDWNRVGPDGKPRQLHIEQAMESIDFRRGPVNPIIPRVEEIDGVGTRERLAQFGVLCTRTTEGPRTGHRGRARSIHDLDGAGGTLGDRPRRTLLPAGIRANRPVAGSLGRVSDRPARRGGRVELHRPVRTTRMGRGPSAGDRPADRAGEDGVADEETIDDRSFSPRRWPGLRIAAAVRMAFDFRKLLISAAGLLLLQLGWTLFDIAFSGSIGVTPDVLPRSPAARPVEKLSWSAETVGRLTHRLFEPGRILATPLNAMLDPRSNVPTMLHALAGVAWLIVVWGLCGGAIARIAVLQEAQLRNPGIAEAVRFAWKSGDALVLAPFCFLGALAFCSLSGLLLGLIYRLPGGEAVAGALLFIPLLAGLVMTLLVVTLIAGWPFFHAALAAGAERRARCDEPDI